MRPSTRAGHKMVHAINCASSAKVTLTQRSLYWSFRHPSQSIAFLQFDVVFLPPIGYALS
jgi:hypothetical protein